MELMFCLAVFVAGVVVGVVAMVAVVWKHRKKFGEQFMAYVVAMEAVLGSLAELGAGAAALPVPMTAALKSGVSSAGSLARVLEDLWWAVVNGRKPVALLAIDGLIAGQRIYQWFWSKVKKNPDAVAQADKVIAELETFRARVVAYQS